MKNIYIYCHVCCMNNWQSVMANIFTQVKDSGLYDIVKEIRCSVFSSDHNFMSHDFFKDPKIRIVKLLDKNEGSTSENTILNILAQDSKHENFYVLYLHSKGVSDRHNDENIRTNIEAWVNYLLYFNVIKHKFVLENLENYDAISVNLNGNSHLPYSQKFSSLQDLIDREGWCGPHWPYHFSGNFWWSKSEYIRQINPCNDCYPGAEIWITNGGGGKIGKFLSVWNAHTDLYGTFYDPSNYTDKDFVIYEKSN